MRKTMFLLLSIVITGVASAQDTTAAYRKLDSIAIIDQKVMMPMRDGVRLATDIYRPKGNAKAPIIFSRTPYNFNTWIDGKMTTRTLEEAYSAVSRGYALVVQNERGRFFSEGEWDILG
ncbi:MAG: CocE/NonD family hydrolase, partial [Chitinophagaceae bacterium]